jgi:hypothetical protein
MTACAWLAAIKTPEVLDASIEKGSAENVAAIAQTSAILFDILIMTEPPCRHEARSPTSVVLATWPVSRTQDPTEVNVCLSWLGRFLQSSTKGESGWH